MSRQNLENFKNNIVEGNKENIVRMLKLFPELAIAEHQGKFMFHIACEKGNLEIVESFIRYVKKIDIADSNKNTALHIACNRGDTNLLKFLIKCRGLKNIPEGIWGEIFEVARQNNWSEGLELLLLCRYSPHSSYFLNLPDNGLSLELVFTELKKYTELYIDSYFRGMMKDNVERRLMITHSHKEIETKYTEQLNMFITKLNQTQDSYEESEKRDNSKEVDCNNTQASEVWDNLGALVNIINNPPPDTTSQQKNPVKKESVEDMLAEATEEYFGFYNLTSPVTAQQDTTVAEETIAEMLREATQEYPDQSKDYRDCVGDTKYAGES